MEPGFDLSAVLRELRKARSLSLGEAALRSGVPKQTLSDWESGGHRPRGAGLVRLLDALGADARPRARILQAADPAFARVELAKTPLGAPVHVGLVIRAMRGRRGATQADLARTVGVTQATVARWESGDLSPSGETIHAVGFALGARAEETAALACASDDGPCELPADPREAADRVAWAFRGLTDGPSEVYEAVSLGLEADVWHRAARDSSWDGVLALLIGDRANRYFCAGRIGEVEDLARRALRLARTPESRTLATRAVGALVAVARHRGHEPGALARSLESWIDRIEDSEMKGWMMWELALCRAELGDERAALDLTRREADITARHRPLQELDDRIYLETYHLSEALLHAGRPEKAMALWSTSLLETSLLGRLWYMRAKTASGGRATPEEMEDLRALALHDLQGNWITRERVAKLERQQARLRGSPEA